MNVLVLLRVKGRFTVVICKVHGQHLLQVPLLRVEHRSDHHHMTPHHFCFLVTKRLRPENIHSVPMKFRKKRKREKKR